MSVKEVKRFLDVVKNNREYSEFVREKLSLNVLDGKHLDVLMSEDIIPFARKHNFDVTKEDFENYAEKRDFSQLGIEELEDVAGGKNVFSKSAISMFMCLTEVAGFASSNFAHAEKPNPTKAVVQDEGKGSVPQDNSEEQTNQNENDDIYATDNMGRTALHRAVANNSSKELVETLISKGADINAKDSVGFTPLHLAAEITPSNLEAQNNRNEIVELLISKGADINAKDSMENTPLHLAAQYNQKEIGELLIRKGADINAKGNLGYTPLHIAAWVDGKEIGEMLIEKGEAINAKNGTGNTPLYIAASRNSKKIAELLISKSKDIIKNDFDGKVTWDNGDIANVLRMNINTKDKDGKTMLHYAVLNGDKDLVETLIREGAYIGIEDNDKKIPLDYNSTPEIGEFLNELQNEVLEQMQKKIKSSKDADELKSVLDEAAQNLPKDMYRREVLRGIVLANEDFEEKDKIKPFDIIASTLDEKKLKVEKELPFYNYEILKKFHDAGFTLFEYGKDELVFDGNVFKDGDFVVAKPISESDEDIKLKKIIEEDNREELQAFCLEHEGPLKSFLCSFNGEKETSIPLMQYCVIKGAINCFKYLLVNYTETAPMETMKTSEWKTGDRFYNYDKWDCMAMAIYFNRIEMIKILEEHGIEKGRIPEHIEVAILSYQNSIAKEIIEKLKERNDSRLTKVLKRGLFIAARHNNLKGAKLLIESGANANAKAKNGERSLISNDIYNRNILTPLHWAVNNYSKGIIELLISKGANVNEEDSFRGVTPLQCATERNSKELVELLISKGANVNAKDNCGETPLIRATRNNNKELIELLISKGAEVNAGTDYNGWSPLSCAVKNNNKEVVELLLSKGADVNGSKKKFPLEIAAENNSKEIVELLISKGADVERFGGIALVYASKNNNKEMVELLLSKGAYVNVETKYDCWTPLNCAVKNNNKAMVELLLSKGADINGAKGKSSLEFAAENNSKDVFWFLLDRGADIDTVKGSVTKLLYCAIKGNSKEIADFLIQKKGADVNARGWRDVTPLHKAASNGSREMVELLISKGANINAKDSDEETPLHKAASNGNREIVEILISKGSNINEKGRDEETPLHKAVRKGSREIVAVLIGKGANINEKDRKGQTPLHYAADDNREEIGKLLISKGADINARDYTGKTPGSYNRDWLKSIVPKNYGHKIERHGMVNNHSNDRYNSIDDSDSSSSLDDSSSSIFMDDSSSSRSIEDDSYSD